MRGRIAVVVGLTVGGIALAALAASPATIELHSLDIRLPGPGSAFTGTGAAILNRNCTLCHSPTFVDTQPALSAATWQAEVMKMKQAFGAPIDLAAIPAIVKALVDRHGEPSPGSDAVPEDAGAAG